MKKQDDDEVTGIMMLVETSADSCPDCGYDMDLYDGEMGKILMCCNCQHVKRPEPEAEQVTA